MTRSEAEELFISVVLSEDSAVVKITLQETQVFRVLVGRILKEMERKNKAMWLKAREFGIEYHEPYAVIKRKADDRYKLFKLNDDGSITDFNQSMSKNDITEEGGGNDESK